MSLTLPATALAVPINPDPGAFGDDLGASLFVATGQVAVSEVGDLLGDFGLLSVFGFYYASAPEALIPILGADDQGGSQQALVDFDAGVVVDLDASTLEAPVIEANFAPRDEPIGFFLFAQDDTDLVYGAFSQPELTGGIDGFAAFPFLDDPTSLLLAFDDLGPNMATVALEVASGGLAAVPEPGTSALLGGALVMLLGAARRLRG